MEEVVIYVSSRNNYSMLAGEVLKKFDFEGCELINVDDRSEPEAQLQGKTLCAENNILYLQNPGKGIQMATHTVMKFVKENRPNCKWLICFQHDTYPLTEGFFTRIGELARSGKIDQFGVLGFNMLDLGEYCLEDHECWKEGEEPLSGLALFHLSVKHTEQRVILPHRTDLVSSRPELYTEPFIAEFPMWTVVGINVEKWFEHITPTEDYEFHLWMPDICVQFMAANVECLILPKLYYMNNQHIKERYGIPKCSAGGARAGQHHFFGEYGPHLINFKKRWGWDYEDIDNGFPEVLEKYKGTLIDKYYHHDPTTGPLKSYHLGNY